MNEKQNGAALTGTSETAGSVPMVAHLMANRIRIMAFQCKSKDVMSCEFGNEFGRKVEEFLEYELPNAQADFPEGGN